MNEIRYFEVCFPDGYSMIIKAVKEPSIEEAEEFVKADMIMSGNDHVDEIIEWTREEALTSFDFTSEDFWPVFGEEN